MGILHLVWPNFVVKCPQKKTPIWKFHKDHTWHCTKTATDTQYFCWCFSCWHFSTYCFLKAFTEIVSFQLMRNKKRRQQIYQRLLSAEVTHYSTWKHSTYFSLCRKSKEKWFSAKITLVRHIGRIYISLTGVETVDMMFLRTEIIRLKNPRT